MNASFLDLSRRCLRPLLGTLVMSPTFLPLRSDSGNTPSACAAGTTLLLRSTWSPDDVVSVGSRLLFTDTNSGALLALNGKRVAVVARGLDEPEGIVARRSGAAVVAEQRSNRLSTVDLGTGRARVFFNLANATKAAGIDGIAPAPHGGIFIPDSPNGRLLMLDRNRHLHVLATHLQRPVGAASFRGGIAVPDELAHAIWYIKNGRVTRMATLDTPDDVVVFRGRLLAVTLGDHALWQVTPVLRRLSARFVQPQGLTSDGHAVVVADSGQNALFKVSRPFACDGESSAGEEPLTRHSTGSSRHG